MKARIKACWLHQFFYEFNPTFENEYMPFLERNSIHQRLYKKYEKTDCVEFDYFFQWFICHIYQQDIETYNPDLINNWTYDFINKKSNN